MYDDDVTLVMVTLEIQSRDRFTPVVIFSLYFVLNNYEKNYQTK